MRQSKLSSLYVLAERAGVRMDGIRYCQGANPDIAPG